MTEKIGSGATLSHLSSSRLVISDFLRGHQQSGNGIYKGGFAGANVAGEQSIGGAQVKTPHPVVKSAPVVDLEALQAKASSNFRGRGSCALGLQRCIKISQKCSPPYRTAYRRGGYDTPQAAARTD